MKRTFSVLLLSVLAISAFSQDIMDFENESRKVISVYDYWDGSPFRKGLLHGECEVIDNPVVESGANETRKVLSFRRSRYGSNLFGARIDLKNPILLSSKPSYVHVMINSPVKCKPALLGLGKRDDWDNQSPETFQFVKLSAMETVPGKWIDAVFKITGNEAACLHSLVIIPDTRSMMPADSDFIVYIDEIIHNNDPLERCSYENYPVSFDKRQTSKRADRKLNGVAFKGNKGADLDIDVSNVKTVYIDKLESETLVAVPGEEITSVFQYTGGKMHRYVYLDKGNDGKFQPEFVKKVPAPGSDLVSYSFLGEPDASIGHNSKGETTQNSTQDNPPAFIIPEDITPGFYRMRCKVDWNSDNASGNTAQSIVDNGGAILDLLVNIHEDSVAFNVNARMCNVSTVDGRQLPSAIPFGKDYTFKVEMDGDYVLKGLLIKHGYNLSGEQYVSGNRQWKTVTLNLSDDGLVTIPAEYIDGDLNVEILFTNIADKASK